MKPIKLVMGAFGSYADTQTIDFARLGDSGLYLISGETGSGKTTIFDAVSFALFGRASGSGRDEYQMLRSDFADEKAKTFVELDFVCGAGRYYIRRAIKKTGQDVELRMPDGEVYSGDRNIKPMITEIIGLDRDQFAQIVMIAQNDFRRFLQSGTDERLKILRRIFGTEALKQFQEQLKARVKRESEKRDIIIHDFDRYKVNVYERERQFAQWEAQIISDKAELAAAERKLVEYDRRKQELAAEIAVATELAGRFSELADCRSMLEEHAAQAGTMASLRADTRRGEVALRRVKPFADSARRAEKDYRDAVESLQSAKTRETASAAEFAAAESAIAELPPLGEAKQAYERVLREWEQFNGRREKLIALDKSQREIVTRESELSALQLEYAELDAEYRAASDRYELIDSAFLAAQAGLLAQTLRTDAPCPVCGSTRHPAPAKLSGGDVSEETRKKAKRAADSARDKRDEKSAECGKLSSTIETLKSGFLANLAEFIHKPDWETSGNKLAELLEKTRSEADKLTERKTLEKKSLDELISNWDRANERKARASDMQNAAAVLVTERVAAERRLLTSLKDSTEKYVRALGDNGFADGGDYRSALMDEDTLAANTAKLTAYEVRGGELARDAARLESGTNGRTPPDLGRLSVESETVDGESKILSDRRDVIKAGLDKTRAALGELRRAAADFEKVEKVYAAVKQLADTANGRLDFETYAQMAYFGRVLRAANQRLKLMSQNRYVLLRKEESGDRRAKTGLEIEVLDGYTGKARSAGSLSGGESFMASLSLALGLSDVVQQSAGGIHLDAMFIDEGFGSLDAEVLELAVRTLSEMAGTNRIIGIISHVAELRERIDRQILVQKTPAGSRIGMAV